MQQISFYLKGMSLEKKGTSGVEPKLICDRKEPDPSISP